MTTDIDRSPIERPSFWRRSSTRRRLVLGTIVVLGIAALVVVIARADGFSGSDDSAESIEFATEDAFPAATAVPAVDMEMAEEEAMSAEVALTQGEADGDGRATALANGVPTVPTNLPREIIYTASVAVQTADVPAAAAHASSIVQELGGFIFGQETYTEGHAHTTLVFKIDPKRFAEALHRLSGVGELVSQTVNAQDVTGAIVDLDSRIASAATSVERMRQFLSQATDVEGVAELERELSERETNLERLRGQLRAMRDQVSLATITLAISESVEALPPASLVLRAWLAAGDDDPCFGFNDVVTEPKDEVGICIELENDGELALADVDLSSHALRFRNSDLTVSPGIDLARLEPGQHATAILRQEVSDGRIAGRVATRGLSIDIRVSAIPVTASDQKLARIVRDQTLYVTVPEDDSPPGFTDALGGGWDALLAFGSVVLLVIGALLPFVPVVAVALAVAWWWLRRRRARQAVPAPRADEV